MHLPVIAVTVPPAGRVASSHERQGVFVVHLAMYPATPRRRKHLTRGQSEKANSTSSPVKPPPRAGDGPSHPGGYTRNFVVHPSRMKQRVVAIACLEFE